MRAHSSTHMRSQEREPHLVRAGGGEIYRDMSEEPFCMEIFRKTSRGTCHKSHFVWKFKGKNRTRNRATHCVWKYYRKKRTWTCHKSDCVWTFTGKMPHTSSGAILCGNLGKRRTRTLHKSHFCVETYKKNAGRPRAHLDQTPGLLLLP